ncbi:MAG TPA: aminoacyl-tRNA hydrolase [Solirubrobacteraceae bacterium]|nr:aminoacyl-tRNA hydrolase [Solirubrobacteraceae bacterium]
MRLPGAQVDWLVVGLGNPGREYARTRHNLGFLVADALAERWQLPRPKTRFRGLISEGRVSAPAAFPRDGPSPRPRVAVLWPQTFMNEAGSSVGPARGSLKLPLERVLVVHDEIDLPFGDVRTRLGGGLAGHNGLKSLKRELGSPDFMRVRAGVGRPNSTDPEIVSAHVLGRFREPVDQVEELIGAACEHVERVVLGEGGDGDGGAGGGAGAGGDGDGGGGAGAGGGGGGGDGGGAAAGAGGDANADAGQGGSAGAAPGAGDGG